jgi:hypothetical protein
MTVRAPRTVFGDHRDAVVVLPAPGRPKWTWARAVPAVKPIPEPVRKRGQRWQAGHWRVETATLSMTPNPSRPGDPERHIKPRDYLKVSAGKTTWAWVPTKLDDPASSIGLRALAAREGWSVDDLVEVTR